jgi:hypothetical protein
VKQQIDQVIAERITAADLIIDPEREVGQRAGLVKAPKMA